MNTTERNIMKGEVSPSLALRCSLPPLAQTSWLRLTSLRLPLATMLILLIAVCSNATEDWNFDYETGGSNFTKKQRWQTGALNILPGVGSYYIMDDWHGAVVQWGLGGGGIVLLSIGGILDEVVCLDDECETLEESCYSVGGILLISSFIYNIYRSITYDKPKKTAYSENSGFNIAVLPNRNGKLNAFLMYNKAF